MAFPQSMTLPCSPLHILEACIQQVKYEITSFSYSTANALNWLVYAAYRRRQTHLKPQGVGSTYIVRNMGSIVVKHWPFLHVRKRFCELTSRGKVHQHNSRRKNFIVIPRYGLTGTQRCFPAMAQKLFNHPLAEMKTPDEISFVGFVGERTYTAVSVILFC